MIKVYCDICENEVGGEDFMFEATKAEMVTVVDDWKKGLSHKKMDKQMIQICRACYNKHIKGLIYKDGKKDNEENTTEDPK